MIHFGGPAGGVDLDPLSGATDPRKPLLSKLLAVPALKTRYLQYVRTIATEWLDWSKLQPVIAGYRTLIEKEVEADTRKLTSLASFQAGLGLNGSPAAGPDANRGGRLNFRQFAEQRRKYLLNHAEVARVPAQPTTGAQR
jgi:hypothetical protein